MFRWKTSPQFLLALLVAVCVAPVACAGSPEVAVEIATTQEDPTNASPVVFQATFSEPVIGFDASDVSVTGTGGPGTITLTSDDHTVFTIRIALVEDGTQDGTLTVSIPAGVCTSVSTGEENKASTSADSTVLLDTTPPPEPTAAWPPEGAVLSTPSPTFSWNSVEDEAGGSGLKNYRVTITGPLDRSTYTTNTAYTPSDLYEGSGYAWRVYARDNAGNNSPYTWRSFTLDTSAPLNPTITHPSHATDAWSSDPNIPIAVADAWDRWSFVDGFEAAWDRSSTWNGTETANHDSLWSGGPFTATDDGEWWFHLVTVDAAGNWSDPVHLGPFLIDTTDPADPSPSSPSHTVNVWSNDDAVEIDIPGADDASSGIAGFEVEWNRSTTWTPTRTKEHSEDWTGDTFGAAPDGGWYFHIAAVDNAGNWTGATHLGPFPIDTEAPTHPEVVCTSHTAGVWSADPVLRFEGFASSSDALSGMAGCHIAWVSAATGVAAETWFLEADHPQVGLVSEDGSWHLTCQAVDHAVNPTDISPFGPYRIDTTAPTIRDAPRDVTVRIPYGEETATCTWEEPTATDLHSGLRNLLASHAPGDLFPLGTTPVTYTATDLCGNASTVSFDVTVTVLPQTLFIAASDDAAGFLDRCLDLEEGEEPPMAGCRELQAVYALGETILGSCGISGADGHPCTSSYVIVTLYAVDITSDPEGMEPLDSWNARYDPEETSYRFEADTTGLVPGIYDLRLGFEDGSTAWIRVEVVEADGSPMLSL